MLRLKMAILKDSVEERNEIIYLLEGCESNVNAIYEQHLVHIL
jgi:hypothetical protein